ncbi:hypothetical protein PIB30_058282 [Stylosanthes scabra]|uniref:Uncharacterized protein n=1 Tax=Stylosanthes scabra TaxID=79078 RepID=A0ABU6VJ98_9FABA|nr:hypothetical protein [Stylosanthes scabra]
MSSSFTDSDSSNHIVVPVDFSDVAINGSSDGFSFPFHHHRPFSLCSSLHRCILGVSGALDIGLGCTLYGFKDKRKAYNFPVDDKNRFCHLEAQKLLTSQKCVFDQIDHDAMI